MSIRRRKTVNYLSNSILLKEIHKSKSSYCEFDDKKHQDYDAIVESLDDITDEVLAAAKTRHADRINELIGDGLFAKGYTNKQITQHLEIHGTKPQDILLSDLTIRVLTNEHIPLIKGKNDKIIKAPVNFPPFMHYALIENEWKCVGKSHYYRGKFSTTHGRISHNLAKSYILIVERYSKKANWRNYTWLEEMAGRAIVRLTEAGLQFNEFKSDNPFAYLTTILKNSFTYVLLKEKENVNIRSKLIQEQGFAQSFNDQADADYENFFREKNISLAKDDNYNTNE